MDLNTVKYLADLSKLEYSDEKLEKTLRELRDENWLIVLLTAGPADTWLRGIFQK